MVVYGVFFFFSSRRRHTRFKCDWSSDVCSSDLSSEVDGGDGQRERRGTVLDECGNALNGAQIGLVDDAGLALDAGRFHDVVIEFASFAFGDEGSHRRGILNKTKSQCQA